MSATRLCIAAAAAVSCAIGFADAATWYVDDDADAAIADGSAAKPFRTLQAAADAASAGDTIRVAAGNYAEGVTNLTVTTGEVRCRLYVCKKLRFVAADGKGTAHIVGVRDDDDPNGAYGMGANAARCVFVDYSSTSTPLGADTVFDGFVFRDGYTCYTNATAGGSFDTAPNLGGGIFVTSSSKRLYLVDCVISNCAARYGGAIQGGTLIRTLVANNGSCKGAAAFRKSIAVNCVAIGNRQLDQCATAYDSTIYNSTFVCNGTQWGLAGASYAYNVLSVSTGTRMRYSASDTIANCVSAPEDTNAAAVEPAPHGVCQLMSSFADWRPVTTGDAVGAGDASHLANVTVPEDSGIDVYKDFYGNEIPRSGAIQVGAVQATATPAGGALYFKGESHLTLDGCVLGKDSWIYPETYPTQFAFKAANDGTTFLRIARLDPSTGNENIRYYPAIYPQLKDGIMYAMPSPDATAVHSNVAKIATQVFWLDPYADASVADGSESKPFRTLQAAFDAASTESASNTLVLARAGSYAEDATTNSAHGAFRLVAAASKDILFRAVDGPDATFIVGEADAGRLDDEEFPGCGTNAVSAVLSTDSRSLAIQGFTIKDCFSGGAEREDNGKRGAFVAGGSYYPQALDCIFTNNLSARTCVYGGIYKRCKFIGNRVRHSICNSGTLASCFLGTNLVDNVGSAANGYFGGTSVNAYNCTLIGTPRTGRVSGQANYFNCIVDGGYNLYNGNATVIYYRSIVHNYGNSTSNTSDWQNLDPRFVDRETDCALLACSPAYTLSYVPTMENYGADYFKYATSDVNGDPIVFTEGVPAVGAYQTPVPYAVISIPSDGLSLTGGSVGTNALSAGASIVIGPGNSGTTPCCGVSVNGVATLFTTNTPFVTITAADAVAGSVSIEAVYTNELYVSETGDDANTGFTPITPKKTLATAAAAVPSGGTLWVMPGVYATGSALHDASKYYIHSRVVVYADTTVKSTDGPEKTFIVGAAATEYPDDYGRGTNAIRCAALKGKGAVLSGFTLTGGRTGRGGADVDDSGGGVIGSSSSARDFSYGEIVENCIISNNFGVMGAAATWCQLVGCRVTDNFASNTVNSCVIGQGAVFGTYIDNNVMQGNLFYYSANVCGSIIGPNNRKCDGKAVNVLGTPGFSPNTKGRMYNSLFCQRAALGSGAMEIRNCVFPDTSTFRADDDTNDTVVLTAAANLALNEDGTPKIGVNPAVDAADLSLYDFDFSDASFNATDLKYAAKSMASIDAWCRGAKDLNGNMRIANGRADVGCFEADWLGQYAAILGGRCTVVSAPSNAVAEAGGSVVAIGDGEMALAWGPSASSGATSRATNYTMHGRVTGTGDLSVIVNGETVATFGAAAGDLTIPFRSALAVNDVRFVYAAGENDDGGAELWGFSRSSGTAVIIR